ncbi:thiamine pyrophosphate binding domain-containing protein [Mycolicibacterium canariasense]|uniref:Thiamine pyrophosphate binding domain-containing protein n=1 Tax=Mycolicibacterium canariasense TaxID=228230 RepID=A0A100W970_MYCCR|nr:thiamine pyrophosphate-requiring protein [Mycolicibacterium canariasense]MCV7213243.1 thiamine pyrophosphate-requiring protein [Mycolicibacterium canariasense]ORV19333.1 thiamine pyrophosphate-binding protein [Mycolicibacterium canariasense]GAS93923.1 thiamine pyrophosphate binding domain-containing protein [Mycolicibacterium canariasense]
MAELVCDAIVGRLREWGVKRIYGYAGDGVNPILGALQRRSDPEFVSTRHEELAAFAACGHAKFSGGVGVCIATQGPGAIHLLAGLYDAKLDRRPVVAIVGQVISTALGSGYLQEVDLHVLFKDVCGQYVQTVFAPEQALMAVDNALRTAAATSTPTCLIVPHDVQQAQMPEEPQHSHGIVASAPVTGHARLARPTDDELRRAAEVIDAGERVAVLVGRGAAGAEAEIAALVDTAGAGVACSLLGKPVLDEDAPWHTGVMGHLGTDASAQLMANCDTLVVIGSNDPWTEFYPAPDQARAVQIDIQPRVIGSKYPVEVPVVGSARDTLAALTPRLTRKPDRGWHDAVVRWKRAWQDTAWQRASAPTPHANPELVIRTLSRHLPRNARLAVDVGSVTYWYARHLRLPPGVPAHVSGYLASMGCAMPYGLAAKLDAPDRPVAALVGDGAMQMSGLLDLISVADRWRDWMDPRFVILVLHNGDLAEVSWEQREMEGNPRFPASQRVPSFPYAGYAELLGLASARVTESAQVSSAWQQAFAADRPFVLEAVVDASTPMLPPQLPKATEGRIISALERETDGACAQQRVRQESANRYTH